MKNFYTLAELSNMFYLALTSSKNAQTAAEKYGEEDDFILNFAEYTKTKYNEVMKLIQTLDVFNEVTDYIGGLRKDGKKRYYIK